MTDSIRTTSLPGLGLTGDPGKSSGITYLTLRGSDGYDRVLWVDTSGKLRIADVATVESSSHAPDSDGTVVGAQS